MTNMLSQKIPKYQPFLGMNSYVLCTPCPHLQPSDFYHLPGDRAPSGGQKGLGKVTRWANM